MRYFSVEDAEKLIPDLEAIYKEAGEISKKATLKADIIRELEKSPKRAADAAIERSRLHGLGKNLNALLQKILDMGCMPKGLEPALVDFPHRLDGREVYLCWKLGEKHITHYHGLDEGFSGRKPLPGTHKG